MNIYVVKLKRSENNSAPSWVRTRALMVRRLERRPLTCETIPTALWLLVTWPTAWDAPFYYEFYFEKPYCCWWNRFPTVKKQICFSKCRFYIAIYKWSLVIKNFIKPLLKNKNVIKLVTFYEVIFMKIFIKIVCEMRFFK